MENLITTLKTHLNNVLGIKAVYMYPLSGSPTVSPAIVCLNDGFDNSFETTQDNFKVYTFKVYLWVNVAGKTVEDIWTSVLPKATDSFIEYIDENWNMGANVDGHRVWSRVSGGFFRMEEGDRAKSAVSEMTLQIKLATTN